MAFWGIEVKPGRPVTHSCEKARGRLRISQVLDSGAVHGVRMATLGTGEATKKTVVQCNVGKRAPVLLCAFLPKKTESCHLDLEFEEADDVVFSVIGPRSVYLTGYYVRQSPQLNPHSDTESYGVDIEHTQTEGSSYGSEDDKYEDSFINDDELQVSPVSPSFSNKGMYEDTHENDNSKGRKSHVKQRRKKFQVMDSDNEDMHSHESEDEDEYTLSAFKAKRAVKTASSDDVTAEMGDEGNDEGINDESKQKLDPSMSNTEEQLGAATAEMGGEANDIGVNDGSKPKIDPLDVKDESGRAIKLPLDEGGTDVGNKVSDRPNPSKVERFEGIISSNEVVVSGDTVNRNDANDSLIDQNLSMPKGKNQMQSHDLAKPKKRRKEHSMREARTSEFQSNNADCNVLIEDKKHGVEACANMEMDADCAMTLLELGSVNNEKVKRRKTELHLEGLQTQEIDKKCHKIPKGGALEFVQQSDNDGKDLKGEHQEHRMEEISKEGNAGNADGMLEEEQLHPVLQHDDCMTKLPPVSNEEFQEQQIDNNTCINPDLVANSSQPGKKIKKRKKKAQGKDLNTNGEENTDMTCGDENINKVPIKRRTLSNGLTIEELGNGPPDGKVARPGKKIKIYFTAMLKENGFVFDSNVGKSLFKFRLGNEEFIDGWNVGIDGMRVGDKRRLIIPPSMGFGNHGVGENIPPNSWLVYEIELVSVRK